MKQTKSWWGEHQFTMSETKVWRLGKRCIAIKRSAKEWTIWDQHTHHEENKAITVGTAKAKELFEQKACSRYALSNTGGSLIIEPSLADRSMVIKPGIPLNISPGDEVQIYVSTPLWMTILIPGRDVPLADIAFWRPSDSWFGPSTMHGDLCYSKYTDARLEEGDLESRAFRATTKVTVKNHQETVLKVERLNIPVPALKLYVDEFERFWTEDVTIVQSEEHNKSVSQLKQSTPIRASALTPVSESRELSQKASFLSSIRSLVA